MLIVPCDLPLLTSEDLRQLSQTGEPGSIGIAPDRRGSGTNGLCLDPRLEFSFQFGEHSYRSHAENAMHLGLEPETANCPGLAFDVARVIESVGSGAAGSWSINNLGPRMARRDFDPGFFVEHFIKDLAIALDEAAALRLALPGLAQARQLYEALRAQGGEKLGTQALLLVYERLCGVS